jgi:hypothetical protein
MAKQGQGFLTHFPYGVAQGVQRLIALNSVIPLGGGTYYLAQSTTAISTATLNSGGTGYAVNDTGTIVQSGGSGATYIVNSVSSGAVVTFTITSGGTGYSTATGVLTAKGGAQPGAGSGFTVNITALGVGIDLMTLAAPLPTGAPNELANDNGAGLDGMIITVIDTVGAAHTITFGTNNLNGHLHIATFNGTKGSNITLEAINGVWYAIGLNGVTLS